MEKKMPNLADEMNVSPRQRVTIPEDHVALILPRQIIADVQAMLFLIRKGRRVDPATRDSMKAIAGELLLALLEAENG
jgi:hypothetical protein